MCFSATANFVGSGVLGAVGVVTFRKVKHRRELLFAALPLLFAIHQFIEGFVWLGLDGVLSPEVAHDMGAAFMLYAQGLLPFLLPMSVLLFEPNAKSRQRMLPFVVLGGATTLYILWALTAFPLELYVQGNSIVYINQATNNTAVAVLYVIATCGALFFSEIRMMVVLGAVNLVILLVVMVVKRYAFTSVWCAYAAVASVIILGYFWTSIETGPLFTSNGHTIVQLFLLPLFRLNHIAFGASKFRSRRRHVLLYELLYLSFFQSRKIYFFNTNDPARDGRMMLLQVFQ